MRLGRCARIAGTRELAIRYDSTCPRALLSDEGVFRAIPEPVKPAPVPDLADLLEQRASEVPEASQDAERPDEAPNPEPAQP